MRYISAERVEGRGGEDLDLLRPDGELPAGEGDFSGSENSGQAETEQEGGEGGGHQKTSAEAVEGSEGCRLRPNPELQQAENRHDERGRDRDGAQPGVRHPEVPARGRGDDRDRCNGPQQDDCCSGETGASVKQEPPSLPPQYGRDKKRREDEQ